MCSLMYNNFSQSNAYIGMLVSTYDRMHSLRLGDGLFGHPIIRHQSLSSNNIISTNRTFGAESKFAPETGNTRRCA